MEEEPLQKQELSSELTGLNKGEKQRKKKLMILGISSGAAILVVVAIILIIALVDVDDNKKNDDGDDDDRKEEDSSLGKINCIYDVQNTRLIQILGQEFQGDSSQLDIYIDGKLAKFSREYEFPTYGEHNVSFRFYKEVNMDYMFKDIKDLISVEMISEHNLEITSMISSFENCQNLISFNLYF